MIFIVMGFWGERIIIIFITELYFKIILNKDKVWEYKNLLILEVKKMYINRVLFYMVGYIY